MSLFPSRRKAAAVDVLSTPADYVPRTVTLKARPDFSETGSIGTQFFSGFPVGEEYLPELRGEQALAVYDRMWRSDGTVGAVRRACTLPLLEAQWSVTPASDDPQDIEIAQFVQDNLFSGMDVTWTQYLTDALFMYRDGHSVFEKVWVLSDDGKVRLKKLAPRLSKSIYRWFVDDDGTLDHIEQRVYVPGTKGSTGMFKMIPISGDALVVNTLDKEGSNYLGVSLFRTAYKHWLLKDKLYLIDAIAGERNAMGVPYFEEPQNTNPTNRDAAADTLASLHAHERAYVMVPYGWKFGIAGVSGNVRDLLPSIQHHDLEIAKSVLATFLNLDNTGSYARDWSETSLFLQNLRAVGKLLSHNVNRDVIRPLVDFNWVTDRYPQVGIKRIDQRDIEAYLRGVAQLFAAGAITANPETENALRHQLDLPDLQIATDPTTIDADSQGQAASGIAPEAAAQPAPAKPTGLPPAKLTAEFGPDLADAVTQLLAERPPAMAADTYERIVLSQARAMALRGAE